MIVDITRQRMSIEESYYDAMRQMDAIVHEAEMNIVLEEYYFLQENGVVMEEEDNRSVVQVVKDAIKKLAKTVVDFFYGIYKNIVEKVKKAKDKKKAQEATKDIIDDLKEAIDDVKEESKEACDKVEEASTTEAKKGILGRFKSKWGNCCTTFKNRAKKVKVDTDIYDSNGNKIASRKSKIKVSDSTEDDPSNMIED